MVSHYTVVQYHPGPHNLVDCMAVGVAAYSAEREFLYCCFTKEWERVEEFGRESIDFLYRFCDRFWKWDVTTLERVLAKGTFTRGVQLRQPYPSVLGPDELRIEMAKIFLRGDWVPYALPGNESERKYDAVAFLESLHVPHALPSNKSKRAASAGGGDGEAD